MSPSLCLPQSSFLLSATEEKSKTSISSPSLIPTSLTATADATTSTPSLRLSDFSFSHSPNATKEKAVETSLQIKFLPKIYTRVQEHGGEMILPFSCALEKILVDVPENEIVKYCQQNNIQSSLTKIVKIGFTMIYLIYFFAVGPDEVKCWQIRRRLVQFTLILK